MRLFLLITILFIHIGGHAQTIKAIELAVQKLEADKDLKNALVGFYALDLDENKVVGNLDSNKSMVPASTMKLVTTATAIEMLGQNKRFPTHIKYSGEISGGVLKGNIYIEGGGDPCLGSERFNTHYGDFMLNWANSIAKLGIDSIDGRVIADATIFDEQMIPSTWIWEDIGNYYGAGACGLSIYENKYTVTLNSFNNGDTTAITGVSPPIPNLKFDNYVKGGQTHKDLSYIFGPPYQDARIIRGEIPANKQSFAIKGAIPDPAFLAAFELDAQLRSLGIPLSQSSTTVRKLKDERKGNSHQKRNTITTTWSPKLIEIIQLTNKYSINLFAEHLIKHIGLKKFNRGTTKAGAEAMQLFWKEKGMDIDGLYINDGSGLSRFNGITAKQLVELLKYMNKSENSALFLSTLPVTGTSGTLKNLCRGTAAQGKIAAKSGTMTRVKSYAGYVSAKNKHTIAFAIMVNNYNCTSYQMKKKLEKIMVKLVELEEE